MYIIFFVGILLDQVRTVEYCVHVMTEVQTSNVLKKTVYFITHIFDFLILGKPYKINLGVWIFWNVIMSKNMQVVFLV